MTLAQAVEKVGVGGKLHHILYGQYRVTAIGELNVLLINNDGIEQSWQLTAEGWSPVLSKKRVVLQAWRYLARTGVTSVQFFEVSNEHQAEAIMASGQIRAYDIPDMVFEEGKQVFE